MNIIST